MDKGYKSIYLGFIFLTFHINLGQVQILPSFIAFMIIYSGMNKVSKNYEIEALAKGSRWCGILMFMSLIMEFVTLNNQNFFIENPRFHILWLSLFGIIEIMCVYDFLKGSSEILKEKDNSLSDSYNKKSCIYVVLSTIALVISNINVVFMNNSIWVMIAIVQFCINFWSIKFSKKLGKLVILKNECE